MKKKNSKPKNSYDRQSKVLSVELGKARSVDSDIKGNIVIDYDKDGQIVRIDIYEFSFSDFIGQSASLKQSLKNSGVSFAIK